MAIALVVAQPFGSYNIGDKITDPADVKSLLESHNALRVRKINVQDAPAPAKS
jgi:hypothetical protein